MNPLVSVVMSVYNGEKYLEESIKSILKQKYKNFEFIIINDGSTDLSLNIINRYKIKDKRIILINNNINRGLIYSLNKGLEKSIGKYILRMDADDIALNDRLSKQVNFMEKNKDIAICGSGMKIFFNRFKFIGINDFSEVNYNKIKAKLIFRNCFAHPTIIMRKDILEKENFKYNDEYKFAEDYGLWIEIASKYRVTNIDDILLKYRVLNNSITRVANKDINSRKKVFKKIFKRYLSILGVEVTDRQLDIHFEISMCSNLKDFKYTLEEKRLYIEFLLNNIRNIDYNTLKEILEFEFLNCSLYQNNKQNLLSLYNYKGMYIKIKLVSIIKKKIKKYI